MTTDERLHSHHFERAYVAECRRELTSEAPLFSQTIQFHIITLYNHVNNRGDQYWIDVVNCLMREATYVLDGLLYQDAPEIKEHYTDTGGYTDLIFGLFSLLGFRFAPRLRDLSDQTLYRARKGADYGVLSSVFKKDIRDRLIVEHWDDLNRIAASLKDGLIRPSLLVSRLQSLQRQNPLQEVGRIAKTWHILEYVDDPALRRRVLIGLNKGETLHSLARDISFGRQGRFMDRGYEAQRDHSRTGANRLLGRWSVIMWELTK